MNKLNDFLSNYKLDILLTFDLVQSCIDDSEYKKYFKDNKILDNYIAYRELTSKLNLDPDNYSNLLQDIYKVVWKDLKYDEKDFMIDIGSKRIKSDVMTSAQHTITRYKKFNNIESISKLNENKKLIQFISLYHTLGNYIPVPVGFNIARSGHFADHDYWDLTLMKIREFYDTNDIIKIKELLHSNKYDEKVINCEKWLKLFENFEDFINRNLLQDYVDDHFNVIPFCKNHSWDNNEIDNFDFFFDEVSNRIQNRSKRIIDVLKNMM